MTINEFILFVKAQLVQKGADVPDSIIVMHLNNSIKYFAKYFPDVFLTEATGTATQGLDNIPLPIDFARFEKLKINDNIYYLTPDGDYYTKELLHRCWLSNDAIHFAPACYDGDTYTLKYYRQPNDLNDLSSQIELPEDTHIRLGLYVASLIAPTNDLILERQMTEREFRHRYLRAKPQREVKVWKHVTREDITGV